ncbi:NTP transferase domain-containing protein [Georgenia sp. TF02-10]|uniref:molybdenum cofactor guanylyltransferase n=1 Tax=Georgenia sp. TF02-10 TaxID=2917725 RepID=UPI001FA7E483|nr:NTP transferase domain-containing protein [Georgenia sp. TF02-10]UNX55189.1 NTP transferase domain-containing protein [Georgenia sp. TF02-10]
MAGPGPADAAGFDAVVLAGGTGRRLDGASKPDLRLAGRRLLDHVLAGTAGARRVVVVAPAEVAVPDGVARTLENPPLGGPVAGVAAGLAVLNDGAPAPLVLVLSCDVPRAATAVPRLLAAAHADRDVDGACLLDPAGVPQWLTAAYRRTALVGRLAGQPRGGRGVPVRALVAGLRLAGVPAVAAEATDVDTWSDLAALADLSASGPPAGAPPAGGREAGGRPAGGPGEGSR